MSEDLLFNISDVFGQKELEKYVKITIDIKSPAYFVIKGKRKDGLIDRLSSHGYPLCKTTGKRK